MEKDKLKLSLLKKIISCEDAAILKRVEEVFGAFSEASEAGEEYISSKNITTSEGLSITPEREEELMRRYSDYLQNNGKSVPWEEVKKNLRELDEI